MNQMASLLGDKCLKIRNVLVYRCHSG